MLYVFHHRTIGIMVKRMVSVNGEAFLFKGDNCKSIPAQKIGFIRRGEILGQVFLSFSSEKWITLHLAT